MSKGRFHPRSPQGGRKREPGPEAVGDLVARVVSQAGVGGSGRLQALRRAWRDAVGREMAEQARVTGLRGGVLTVEVDSAALGQELTVYHKSRLLRRLNEQSGVRVTDLRCKVVGRRRKAP